MAQAGCITTAIRERMSRGRPPKSTNPVHLAHTERSLSTATGNVEDFDLLPNDEILPIEFSRCLNLAGGTPRLFHADLLLTGVLFERQLDARISFHNGPFHNSRCGFDDLADSNRVAMRGPWQEALLHAWGRAEVGRPARQQERA
jgi:hypothetical protein